MFFYIIFFYFYIFLYSAKRDFGFDLVSLNIWRGRDHGLPGYNTYRQICGLPRVTNFQELLTIMDRSVVERMAAVYRSVDDIDLYVGGLVESHLPGSMLGPVFSCIIADQFARLKEGDRSENPVSVEKVKKYVAAVEKVRKATEK